MFLLTQAAESQIPLASDGHFSRGWLALTPPPIRRKWYDIREAVGVISHQVEVMN